MISTFRIRSKVQVVSRFKKLIFSKYFNYICVIFLIRHILNWANFTKSVPECLKWEDSRIPEFQDSRILDGFKWQLVPHPKLVETGWNWKKLVETGWNFTFIQFGNRLLVMLFDSMNSFNFVCKVMNDLKNHTWSGYNYIINVEALNLLPITKWIRFSLFRSLTKGSRLSTILSTLLTYWNYIAGPGGKMVVNFV